MLGFGLPYRKPSAECKRLLDVQPRKSLAAGRMIDRFNFLFLGLSSPLRGPRGALMLVSPLTSTAFEITAAKPGIGLIRTREPCVEDTSLVLHQEGVWDDLRRLHRGAGASLTIRLWNAAHNGSLSTWQVFFFFKYRSLLPSC